MKKNTFQILAEVIACCSLGFLVGCSGPSRIDAPEFDAAAIAAEAMSMYDSDSDGQLDEEELKSCMALGNAIAEIDTDGDGLISEAEVQARVEFFLSTRSGRQSLACRVLKSKRPLRGATVTFVPEPFMGDTIQAASGVTDPTGLATINIEDELGGVQTGFYKVEISRPSSSGKETLSAKYNSETILGQEVTTGSLQLAEGLVIEIR